MSLDSSADQSKISTMECEATFWSYTNPVWVHHHSMNMFPLYLSFAPLQAGDILPAMPTCVTSLNKIQSSSWKRSSNEDDRKPSRYL